MKLITAILITCCFGVALTVVATTQDNWAAPARASAKKNPVSTDAASIARGKTAYTAQCFTCHGASGRGDGPQATQLAKNPGNLTNLQGQSDGALFWKVSEGKDPMPRFAQMLSEQQRWDVVNYIHTLSK
jgi:mono/diheme cytochrome c family protein